MTDSPGPDSNRKVRVAQFGVGPIGIASLQAACETPWAEVVGAIDNDPHKIGKGLDELANEPRLAGRSVFQDFDALHDATGGCDLVLHTAGSRATATLEQLQPIVSAGIDVASTCEELLFPYLQADQQARRFDELCRRCDASVVGTGVNPGFAMDLLPVLLTAVSLRVDKIVATRVVDATTRRGPLQRKIGSGMTPDDFRERFRRGEAGHAGFRESAALIGHAMGWPLDDIEETLDPVVADRKIETPHVSVDPATVRGLHQRCTLRADGVTRVELDLTMALGEEDPFDRIELLGDPHLRVRFDGGIPGDKATVAALLSAGRRLGGSRPGLLLMTDLPAPRWSDVTTR
jgi:2,4-diaminopentanoate dehydrogenase